MRLVLPIVLGLVLAPALADGADRGAPADSLPVFTVPGLRVEAPRPERAVHEDPAFLNRLGLVEIRDRRQARTLPEALTGLPGVMIQKTAHGQGSPFLRGFTGFRTLMLIDGIRLNNSVFRDGPNQYWATVDPFLVGRLDVVRGPSAVLQGSDAVGGLVQVTTPDWRMLGAEAPVAGRLVVRGAGAERSGTARLAAAGRLGLRAGYAAGISARTYGDLEGGGGVGRQRHTGYDEFDGDLRLDFDLSERWGLAAAHQVTRIDDAWRTHRTIHGISWEGTTVGNDKEHVFDQERSLSYLQLKGSDLGDRLDQAVVSVSWHRQTEDRHRLRADDRSDDQGFEVGTLGLWGEFRGRAGSLGWTAGADYYRDAVDSYSRRFAADGALQREDLQGPVADDATYELAGLFASAGIPLGSAVKLQLGARVTGARVDAREVTDPGTGDPITVEESWGKVTGSGRLAWTPDGAGRWTLFTGLAQAFRAPNLSDLTRFDIARSNEIEVPSTDLEPENFLTWDLGVKWIGDRLAIQAAAFHTDIDGMIVRRPTGREIDGSFEVTKANAGSGFMTGVEAEARVRFDAPFEVVAAVGKTYGEVDDDFVGKMPPLAGNMAVAWRAGSRGRVEAILALAERQDQLSASDRSDTQRIPPGGTPGFAVLSLRSAWELSRSVGISLALENVTDADYRIHGSGQNEPGFNVVAGTRIEF